MENKGSRKTVDTDRAADLKELQTNREATVDIL